MDTLKLLVDTSCVHAVLDRTLMPWLSEQLPAKGPQCEYWTTQYLRMEFFRRWILTGIEVFSWARRRGSLKEALAHFSNKFGARTPKIVLVLVAMCLDRALKEPPSEAIEDWGWQVYRFARLYDKLFDRYVAPPLTCCKRGQVAIDLDAPLVRKALEEFYDRFTSREHDCGVLSLLDRPEAQATATAVLAADISEFPGKVRRDFKKARAAFSKVVAHPVTCKTCSKVGDVLIAIEQPSWAVLYHSDHLFDALCTILEKPHQKVRFARPAV